MLLLTSTSDKVQVITDAAGTVKAHASWLDNLSGTITPGRTNTAAITTAATTDVVAAPAASTQRNVKKLSVRNTDAVVSQNVTIQHTDGTNVEPLWKGQLLAGEAVIFDAMGRFTLYDASGIMKNPTGQPVLITSTADQAIGASVTAYLTNSGIVIPANSLRVGSVIEIYGTVTKTAAATASMTFDARYGPLGTTGDASKANVATGTQTAVADTGEVKLRAIVRSLGAAGSIDFFMSFSHGLNATGLGANSSPMSETTATCDTTVANTLGISLTTGASHAITVKQVYAKRFDPLS